MRALFKGQLPCITTVSSYFAETSIFERARPLFILLRALSLENLKVCGILLEWHQCQPRRGAKEARENEVGVSVTFV